MKFNINFAVFLTLVVFAIATSVSAGKKHRSYGWDNEASDKNTEDSRKHVMVNCGSGGQALTVAVMQKLTSLAEKFAAQSEKVNALSGNMKFLAQNVAALSKRRGKKGPPGMAGPAGPKGSPGTGGGTTYVRYGRKTCPSTSNLVYSGSLAGSNAGAKGSGTQYLCLRKKFQWNKYTDANDESNSLLYGTEYEVSNKFFSTKNSRSFIQYNVPCALCHTPARGARIMIAGGRTCEKGWTREYEGYILTEHQSHNSKEYVCVDEAPEVIAGTHANKNGALMYKVQASCPGQELPCKTGYRELTCVVCTK